MDDDAELIAEFVSEASEHLEHIEGDLLTVEESGDDFDPDLVNKIFRGIHSIKGIAGFIGLTSIGELSHSMENVLNLLRNRQLSPSPQLTDVLLTAADILTSMVKDVHESNSVDVSEPVAALQRIAEGEGKSASQAATTSTTVESDAEPTVESTAGSKDAEPEPAEPSTPETSAPPTTNEVAAPAPAQKSTTASKPEAPESTIRVTVRLLDHLMNLAGELVLSRNQLMRCLTSDDLDSLSSVAGRIDLVTSGLQESIVRTRMQPVGAVFNRFPRIVRDLSKTLGKQCRLEITGSEVELDKSIIEAIGDPLTHLIRNSVDHGLELPEQRRAAAKREEGTVWLRAFHQAGKVIVEIQDDGRGIDSGVLRDKAVSKGILTADQASALSEKESLALIFAPGFSTAQELTSVSGRGVGMDVVRTNIEKSGGTVEIDTEVGAGTTIRIRLPLTLAILPSLVVRVGSTRYSIPQVGISELVRIRQSEMEERIERIRDAEVLRLRGGLLPLVRLRDVLEPSSASTLENDEHRAISIVVVEGGNFQYGVVVDELFESEEIVVKALGRHLNGCPCFSGATILGDGTVALILDIAGLAKFLDLRAVDLDLGVDAAADAGDDAADGERFLLFTNHPEERFAVPTSVIKRIECVQLDDLDTVGDQKVVNYRGESLPVFELEQMISARPKPEGPGLLYVVVFDVSGKEIGLLTPRLDDARPLSGKVDGVTFRELGVLGSLVIDGSPTRVLDIFELCQVVRPEWFQHRLESRTDGHEPLRILLAEDSEFFRAQVTSYLESDGHTVVSCPDGQAAWERLQQEDDDFELLITDVEMPRWSGLELTRNVRADGRWDDLPILALSTLAAEVDVAAGYAAGVTSYQVKMDREKLLATVEELGHVVATA